jgi:enoyl-CoA hydratase/carnithine racemase
MYLGLTGARLRGFDLKEAGVATHFVPSDKLPALEDALCGLTPADCPSDPGRMKDLVNDIISSFEVTSGDCSLAAHWDQIFSCFGAGSVEEILERLREDGSDWAVKTVDELAKMSPTSLKVTFEALRRGAALHDIRATFEMEYTITQHLMRDGADFFEGVRAKLVDKDQNPRWSPSRLQEMTDVAHYFQPGPGHQTWGPA